MNLGPHAAFIWLSYGIVAVAIGAMIGWLVHDGRRHEQRLRELDKQGIKRRSAEPQAGQVR